MGVDRKAVSEAAASQLRTGDARHSAGVTAWLANGFAPYQQRWQLDHAQLSPVEKHGRNLALHRGKNLLPTDAFSTRPTYVCRIILKTAVKSVGERQGAVSMAL
jgi:hypothetical protein